jgi:hypothetical protein
MPLHFDNISSPLSLATDSFGSHGCKRPVPSMQEFTLGFHLARASVEMPRLQILTKRQLPML